MGTTVAPEQILKELADLWVESGKQERAGSGAGVLRACSMTLLVLAESSEDTQVLGETIAALMPEHPARTILVRLSGEGERALAERVYSQCWMPFGQRRQICCEQVEITVSDAALAKEDQIEIPVQINGKLRSVIRVAADADNAAIEATALDDEKIIEWLAGRTPVKIIIVPGKLVNLVVK